MRSIGILADKNGFDWLVLERVDEDFAILADARASTPSSYDEANSLRWCHNHIQTLVREWDVSCAAIKYAETFIKQPSKRPQGKKLDSWLQRARIEGVLISALRDSGIEVFAEKWQKISSRLGSRSARAYSESGEFRGVDLSQLAQKRQDLVAIAASMLEA